MAVQAGVRAAIVTRQQRRRNLLPYMLALPILIYEGLFILLPIVQEILSSFTNDVIGAGAVKWVGSANYTRMLNDPNFWKSMRTTLTYMVLVVTLSLIIGLISALLLNEAGRGRSIVRTAITLPWAFPEVPTVLVFLWLLNPSFGVINIAAHLLPGVEQNPRWFLDVNWAMPSVVMISVWKAFPFYSLVLLAAMQTIPAELYEAAKVDGANSVQSFRFITLPSIAPTLTLLGVLACIFAFRQLVLIWLTTGGGPGGATETLVIRVYNTAFRFFDFSYGATLGTAGFIVVFVITVIFSIMQSRRAGDKS
ncbi:MAG: sugar ABC transporter permease [Anaerolineae bacterium]|nr:sugar ABC transporter permease [Anaerolineae bacterium]